MSIACALRSPDITYIVNDSIGPLSASGQKQTYAVQKGMSGLPPKADMCGALAHVCFGPLADIGSPDFHFLNGPIYFPVIEADFDGWLNHSKIRGDVKIARRVK